MLDELICRTARNTKGGKSALFNDEENKQLHLAIQTPQSNQTNEFTTLQ